VAKYALMGGADDPDGIGAMLTWCAQELDDRASGMLRDLVARCAAIKARVVTEDPQEVTGLRATLNYGHTLAHALETLGHHDLHHGEAVGVGLVFAGALAGALERVPPSEVERHREVVARLGLPTDAAGLAADDLVAVMRRDKKASGGLTFVLLGPGGLEIVEDPPDHALAAAFRAVGVDT
jgi:3-dehydroquinate synthetase